MKRSKKKKKKLILKIIYNTMLSIILLSLLLFLMYQYNNKEIIPTVKYNNNQIIVSLNEENLYCILSDTIPTLDDEKWVKTSNKECVLDYTSNNLYIKNNKEIIYNNDSILYLDINTKEKIYLTIGETYDYINVLIGDFNQLIIENDNENAVNIDSNGIIKSIKDGNANIKIKYFTKEYDIQVISTSLIL